MIDKLIRKMNEKKYQDLEPGKHFQKLNEWKYNSILIVILYWCMISFVLLMHRDGDFTYFENLIDYGMLWILVCLYAGLPFVWKAILCTVLHKI